MTRRASRLPRPRSHRRSTDWDGVDRKRLVDTVLLPFRERRSGTFRRFDWSTPELGAPEHVPHGEVMVVDLSLGGLSRTAVREWVEAVGQQVDLDLLMRVTHGLPAYVDAALAHLAAGGQLRDLPIVESFAAQTQVESPTVV